MSDYLSPDEGRKPTDFADLYDSESGECLGPATYAQWSASWRTEDGIILIDNHGDVIAAQYEKASWVGPVRRVYVR